MKRVLLRAAGALLCLRLLFLAGYAAGGPFRIPAEIGERTYTTDAELTALVLIFCIVLLLDGVIVSVWTALCALCGEDKRVRTAGIAILLFSFFLYSCLYGYPLLDNHFTTAWLMTGQYTAQLIKSLMTLVMGIFSMGFSWNETAAWYTVCACLLACPFVLLAVFLGIRNFLPVIGAAALPALVFAVGHFACLSGELQCGLGLAASLTAAAVVYCFSEESELGSNRKKKSAKALIKVAVDDRKRFILAAVCIVLWGVTVFTGKIRSFMAVMRLIFSSDVYKYQNNLYELEDLRIVQALFLSYVLSLIVKAVLSLVKFEDDTRFGGILHSAYMMLLSIWVMPKLSSFMSRAADSAQGAVDGAAVGERIAGIGTPAKEFLSSMGRGTVLPVFVGILLGTGLVLFLFFFTFRLPFVRLVTWFFVWFAVCTYVYCLIGLYYRSVLDTVPMLLICWLLTRMLNRMLSAGQTLRAGILKLGGKD